MSLVLGLLSIVGCQWSHRFRLEDVDQLVPGKSTRLEVERLLGPTESLVQAVYESSERDAVIPPAPLSFVLWPLLFHFHERRFQFTAEINPEGVLTSGTLELFEMSRTRVLLIFGGGSFKVHLTDAELEVLKSLQKKGIAVNVVVTPVLCFGGIIGVHSVPLDDYLREPPQD